jgi:hypothetical protein
LLVVLARAFVARAVHLNHLRFAALLSLGYHALLRTGELLQLQFRDLEVSLDCGVVSLKCSKSGLRSGSQEAVALRDSLCLQILSALLATTPHSPGDKIWPHSAQAFRLAFKRLSPFSMHRNSTLSRAPSVEAEQHTYLLQYGLAAMESILLRGRWKRLAVGRLYLEDGLAQIPSLRFSLKDRMHVAFWANKTPVTTFRPR